MKTKFFFYSVFLLLFCTNTFAQQIQPNIYIHGSYMYPFFYAQNYTGKFEHEARKINFGVTITQPFIVKENIQICSGIRYSPYKLVIYGLNLIPTIHDKPHPFMMKRKFGMLTLPLWLSRRFTLKNEKEANIYAGVSVGVLIANSAENRIKTNVAKNVANIHDSIFYEMTPASIPLLQFCATADFGAEIQPFKQWKNFRIYTMGSFQLNKTRVGGFTALLANISQNNSFSYDVQYKMRYFSLLVGLRMYQFRINQKHPPK